MSDMTTRTDKYGNEIEVPTGYDGKNPVSTWNPPAKALRAEALDDHSDDFATPEQEELASALGQPEKPEQSDKPEQQVAKAKKTTAKKTTTRKRN